MRTDIGKAMLEDFSSDALEQIKAGARTRATILRETSNANRQMDADRFDKLADAIDGLTGE